MQESENGHVAHEDNLDVVELPSGGNAFALIVGIVGGLVSVIFNIGVTLVNSPIFQQATREGKNITTNTATLVVGIQCLTFFVSLLICLLAGYIVGKKAVQRRYGFLTGAVIGLITYLASFLVRYIPNFPGNMTPAAPGFDMGALAGGIAVVIVFVLFWIAIGGMMGVLGARIATRKHPYYQQAAR